MDDKLFGEGALRTERDKAVRLWIEYDEIVKGCERSGHNVNMLSGRCRSCYQYVYQPTNGNPNETNRQLERQYVEGLEQFLMTKGVGIKKNSSQFQ